MKYFLINLKLKKDVKKINEVQITSPEITFKFEEDVIIVHPEIITRIINDKDNSIDLYITNINKPECEESIMGLLDDDYEPIDFKLKFIYEGKICDYDFDYDFISDIDDNFIKDGLLQHKFKNNTLVVTGSSPLNLYGYNLKVAGYQIVAKKIKNYLIKKINESNIQYVISGGALGVETISFYTVEYLKKHGYPYLLNILILPFNKCYTKWSQDDINRFENMKKIADLVLYVDKFPEYRVNLAKDDEYNKFKYEKQEDFIISLTDYIVIFYSNKNLEDKYDKTSKKNSSYIFKANKNNVEITSLNLDILK